MNQREIGEIRRRIRRDRSNMTGVYVCYVNGQKEIVAQYRQSLSLISENEAERYFGLMKRTLSGTLGKNLIDITFQTAQVAGSEEHKLLMDLRDCELKDDAMRSALIEKIVDCVEPNDGYLILMACENYDVPFKNKDEECLQHGSEEIYTYFLCTVCPVKQTKPNLHYIAENKEFHDGGVAMIASAPAFGFIFPAFDNRTTNIYNALFYTRDSAQSYAQLIDRVFHVAAPKPAAEQKKSFDALLANALDEECSMEAVQVVHDQLCQSIELHKQSRLPQPLMISKEQIKDALMTCGISEKGLAKFSVDFDDTFGFEAQVHPKNIINDKKFEVQMPDVSIRVAPSCSNLIQTRVIGGVKYILIRADESVEVNGVPIHIGECNEESCTV